MVTVLSLLNSIGTDASFGHNNSEQSVLAVTSQKITPLFEPMGIEEKNWPATVGIFTGIFAKEAVIATLNSLYSMEADNSDNEPFSLSTGIAKAFKTIPENLEKMADSFLDPLGLSAVNQNLSTVQQELDITSGTVSKLENSFANSYAAMAYLIFILLYTPCAAALGTIYRETGWRWMLFVAGWTFFTGWSCATFYYQFHLLGHQKTALYFIGLIILFIFITALMKIIGPRQQQLPRPSRHNNSEKCCH